MYMSNCKNLRGAMVADCQQGIAMSANYARGSTVADFLEGTATGKNAGQSLKADCGEHRKGSPRPLCAAKCRNLNGRV